ncbi:MAG: pyridinium-3,5-bisthiocarboxylic acid mononucleotide nickel chelatase [Acidobacteriota bacterium]|nr:pyridinium-3,5-bisthiocarboxylic acid mononucleotide nickel chelatase [Acidobacteriota bacterium]
MRTLYFDCFAGISGDMTLGALVGAGVDGRALKEQLALLDLPGYEIGFETVDRSGISATRAVVRLKRDEHQHRQLSDIEKIIGGSRLGTAVKERALKIFGKLAEAEARVHNVAVSSIHFHEVGAVDAIVDVVGACIGFELLGVERFVASALHVGSGTVEMAHGRFPVPPPAVAELLRGAPIYSTDITGELVTPTGAAIVATVCESFGALPRMRVDATGYGAGTREYQNFPNVLRVMVGEGEAAGEESHAGIAYEVSRSGVAQAEEELLMVETNVDDASPQLLGHLLERALACGALDCYLTHVQMKKNRPGVLVSILCRPTEREAVLDLLFAETPTLGVRSYEVSRRALERESVTVETEFGTITVKVGRYKGRVVSASPEFDECREAALARGVPLRSVQEAALIAFRQTSV